MLKWSGYALVALGVVHLLALGADAWPFVPGWLGLELWTYAHWMPFERQGTAVLASNAAFWATLGSCAVPLMILGALIVRLAKDGVAIPGFVGAGLCLWLALCALVLEPGGFPLALLIAAVLWLGIRRQSRRPDA